ncbi:hypothetical protein Mal64_23390 [Pseudobythopirellula maris]|uniref:FHA domain-containing protein n=1 Tax=Pseudobythopirellula maris TaxID=2527991 RepID=A0A5C5ZPX3_9BACT|nr:FHA domain-containing protein [Pseudobythopirellula maris]TWT88851.1 hypothetical protein Mal64_23390 [Pseudobythopirellula maris]
MEDSTPPALARHSTARRRFGLTTGRWAAPIGSLSQTPTAYYGDRPVAGRDAFSTPETADRRMVWVDAVGGFLLCLGDEVAIGQPDGGDKGAAEPTVGVLAGLSRRHAVITRQGGVHVLDPLGPVALDGRPLSGPTVLPTTAMLKLGDRVEMRFSRPHALSATARLEMLSGHRTSPACDAIVLMAESCVLGPKETSHIRCPGWSGEAILTRSGGEISCRANVPLAVSGVRATGPVRAAPGARIEGQDFSFSVELAVESG